MALLCLVGKIPSALNNGNFVLGRFLDFSKAFDTVNHVILLQKLYKYGVPGNCYDWFHSYLSERKQYVIYQNTSSEINQIKCGDPQGSILGPLLFLLYINDIVNISQDIFLLLFADDTNLFINGKNISKMSELLNNELKKVVEWLHSNKLSLNVKKDSLHDIYHSEKIQFDRKNLY